MVSLSPAEQAAARPLFEAEMARRSFPYLLTFAKIRSDDPLNPSIAPWQPWPYLVEQAECWQTGASEVILKDRQLGYSWLAAAYAVWRARNGAAVALISKGQLEAREFLSKCAFVERRLPPHLRSGATVQTDVIKYPDGGVIMAFPSTPDAGVSFTFQLVIMDEAHFHPYAAANYAALRPTVSAGGQFIILSTADPSLGPNGWFPSMYWASKRGETGYACRFVPWHVRPGRDGAWYEAERAAYNGMAEEFDAYYADTDAQAFTGKSGLVYPQWSDDVFVVASHPWEWAASKYRVAGVDFGGGDPTAAIPLGVSGTKAVHQFGEFYERGAVTIDEIADYLLPFHRNAPFLSVECDPSQAVSIASLRARGLPARPADNDRSGIGVLATLLDQRRFTVHESCVSSVAEFPGYRWAERTDPNDKTRYATKTAVDHHGDGMDARRYGLVLVDRLEQRGKRSVVTIQTRVERPEDVGKPVLAQKLRRRWREQERPANVRVR